MAQADMIQPGRNPFRLERPQQLLCPFLLSLPQEPLSWALHREKGLKEWLTRVFVNGLIEEIAYSQVKRELKANQNFLTKGINSIASGDDTGKE